MQLFVVSRNCFLAGCTVFRGLPLYFRRINRECALCRNIEDGVISLTSDSHRDVHNRPSRPPPESFLEYYYRSSYIISLTNVYNHAQKFSHMNLALYIYIYIENAHSK